MSDINIGNIFDEITHEVIEKAKKISKKKYFRGQIVTFKLKGRECDTDEDNIDEELKEIIIQIKKKNDEAIDDLYDHCYAIFDGDNANMSFIIYADPSFEFQNECSLSAFRIVTAYKDDLNLPNIDLRMAVLLPIKGDIDKITHELIEENEEDGEYFIDSFAFNWHIDEFEIIDYGDSDFELGEIIEFNKANKDDSEIQDSKIKENISKEGSHEEFHKNGFLKSKYSLMNGELHGLKEIYCEYEKDKKDTEEYYENGVLVKLIRFSNLYQ